MKTEAVSGWRLAVSQIHLTNRAHSALAGSEPIGNLRLSELTANRQPLTASL